jgi:hypothetical protein
MAHIHVRSVAFVVAVVAVVGATSAYAFALPSAPPTIRLAAAPTPPAKSTAPPPPTKSPSPSPSKPPPPPPPPPAEVCTYGLKTIPCGTASGWWNPVDNCYWNQILKPSPEQWIAIGYQSGAGNLYATTCGVGGAAIGDTTKLGSINVQFDSNLPPGYNGTNLTVPQEEGQQAAEDLFVDTNLALVAPAVQSAPVALEERHASVGLVGVPVWMWQRPGLLTSGPIPPLTIGVPLPPILGIPVAGVNVGVSALGAGIVWDMGDHSAPIACAGLGTPYPLTPALPPPSPPLPTTLILNSLLNLITGIPRPLASAFGPRSAPTPYASGEIQSPNCGYMSGYSKPGTYTLTAAANWDVNWAVGAFTGSITIVRYTQIHINIGELQVVVK